MVPQPMFLVVVVAVTVLSSFTIGFPDREVHGRPIKEEYDYYEVDFRTHSPDDVEGVGGEEAKLPYCDEVEADKPIEIPKLIEEPDAKPGPGKVKKERKTIIWHVEKKSAKAGKEWLKTHARKRKKVKIVKGEVFPDKAGAIAPLPIEIPCLRRDLSQKS